VIANGERGPKKKGVLVRPVRVFAPPSVPVARLLPACVLAAGVLAAGVLNGCGPNIDLEPVGSPGVSGPSAFCRVVKEGPDKGKLIVTVRNKGARAAPATTTKVEFIPGGSFFLPTPAIPARSSVELKVKAPGECWRGGCYFLISVNSGNEINEGDEENNTVEGHCVG
jgi:hypothetical protein